MYKKGDIVQRIHDAAYDYGRTSDIIRLHFDDKLPTASTIDSEGDVEVIWADSEGALLSYDQPGYKRKGHLYYKNEHLKLVRRPEEVINNYSIY